MKKNLRILAITAMLIVVQIAAQAQCSICNKTVLQMGNKPAQGFNAGILFLMCIPFLAIGVVAFKWWRSSRPQKA